MGTACPTEKTTDSLGHLGKKGHVPVPHRVASFRVDFRGLCLMIQHSWVGTDVANLEAATPGQRETLSSGEEGEKRLLWLLLGFLRLPSL